MDTAFVTEDGSLMPSRGTHEEVESAIRFGEEASAKKGRSRWKGRYYETKQVMSDKDAKIHSVNRVVKEEKMEWEYMIDRVATKGMVDSNLDLMTEERLNYYGKKGWELVSVAVPARGGGMSVFGYYYFKRSKPVTRAP